MWLAGVVRVHLGRPAASAAERGSVGNGLGLFRDGLLHDFTGECITDFTSDLFDLLELGAPCRHTLLAEDLLA
jgi:hypothetical protein